MKYLIIVLTILCVPILSFSQTTAPTNNPTNGAFLGWNGAQNLDFKTNNTTRMRLTQNDINMVDNYLFLCSGFLGLSIDPNFFNQAKPFSMLHLHGLNNPLGPQPWGYRDWMVAGITFTHNQDFMYIGPKANGIDKTDAVIAWADNAGIGDIGPDVLRFLFTNRAQGSTSTSSNVFSDADYDGVEVGRMTGTGKTGLGSYWTDEFLPLRTLDVILQQDVPQFGITRQRNTNLNSGVNADFQVSTHGNLHILPRRNGAQRAVAIGFLDDPTNLTDPLQNTFLDVGGLTRIRDLDDYNPNTLIIGYQFEDVNDGDADHFLGRLDFPTVDPECQVLNGEGEWLNICDGLGGEDCRWFDATSSTVPNEIDIFTGFDPLENCNRGKLGVGTNELRMAKIEGHNLTGRDNIFVGIYGNTFVDDQIYPLGTSAYDLRYTGIFGECTGLPEPTIGITSFGVRGRSNVGKYVIGVYGEAFHDINGSTTHTMGVRAEATHSDTYNALNIAVYAEIKPDPVTLNYGNNRALVTVGASTSVGPQIIISDENVKTDITPMENAAEILQQLNPVTYIFESPENRSLPFSQNLQYGLIAQDVQEVMPEVVYSNTIPEAMDSLGIIEGSGLELLGIDYNSFIPILIQGFKEQNATVGDQAAIIAAKTKQLQHLKLNSTLKLSSLKKCKTVYSLFWMPFNKCSKKSQMLTNASVPAVPRKPKVVIQAQ